MGNGGPAINPKLVAMYHEEDPNWQNDDAYSSAQTNLANAEKAAGSDSGRFEVDLTALENLSSSLSKLIGDYFGPSSTPGPSTKLDSDTTGDGKHFGQADSGAAASFAEADDLFDAYNQVQQNLVQLHDAVNRRLTDMQKNIGQVHRAYQGAEDTVHMHATKAKDGDTLLTYRGHYTANRDAAYATVQTNGVNTTGGVTADSSTTSTGATSTGATATSSPASGTSTQNNM